MERVQVVRAVASMARKAKEKAPSEAKVSREQKVEVSPKASQKERAFKDSASHVARQATVLRIAKPAT